MFFVNNSFFHETFFANTFWLWPFLAICQVKEVSFPNKNDTLKTIPRKDQYKKPEILSSGFIDILNNGQVNASARFIRLFIGEPGKLAIPLSIYSGVSSNNFQNQQYPGGQRSNEYLVNSFINPLSGLVNIAFDGVSFFNRKDRVTRPGLLYHGGIRILTGYKSGLITDPATGKPINFLNLVYAAGLYFQTGAWERNNSKNVGVFWLTGRYLICKSGARQLKEVMPDIETNGLYHGWSVGWGIEINNLVNLKAIFYKYVKKPEIDYSLPIYQFSFNYSLK